MKFCKIYFIFVFTIFLSCQNYQSEFEIGDDYVLRADIEDDKLSIYINDQVKPIIVHNMKDDMRPYIHPLCAPGSFSSLTQFSPEHHKHQTGLFWGLTRINGTGASEGDLNKWFYVPEDSKPDSIRSKIGRDFYHYPDGNHWSKVKSEIKSNSEKEIIWETVYNLLDDNGEAFFRDYQLWSIRCEENQYILDFEWRGASLIDSTILNEFDYGGLFLRMPWDEHKDASFLNAARQKDLQGEGKRAMWVDLGMNVEGINEEGHIAILEHKDNLNFPQAWRIDSQFGVGPAITRQGDITVQKGNELKYRFRIIAYRGDVDDVHMDENWNEYVGDDGIYSTASLWEIAQKEGFEAEFLTPEKAVEKMTVKEGYNVNVYASEPMISQPMAFCWDDRGRLWVAENRDYESRIDGFSNSGKSRILILEDLDNDGVVDTAKVFLEGLPFPSAMAVGYGGVFIGAPPNLLFVPVTGDQGNIDDAEILLTGWGIKDRHETINSLEWGPDGWLYGLEGFATPSLIKKPNGNAKIYKHKDPFPENILEGKGTYIDGGVWRYHPVKEKFEVVAHGFSNPWGLDFNAKGQMFITACVIPHMFQIFHGGFYHRQGGQHVNPYVYEDIQTIVDHRHRSAHGGARFYLSDAFANEEYNRIFMCNIHDHGVLSDILRPKGSGYTASHGDDFMLANNAQFVGFSMELGPAGDLFVLDWHDADICGTSVQNPNTGRIFRIYPKASQATLWDGRFDDLNLKSNIDLIELQTNRSSWHARRARIILQYRAANMGKLTSTEISQLYEILNDKSNSDYRLRGLWTLFVTESINDHSLIELLKDEDDYIRGWVVQMLCEDMPIENDRVINALQKLAEKENSPIVRRYLAEALLRIDKNARFKILKRLVQYKEDSDDPNIPLLLWFGLEPLVMEKPGLVLELTHVCQINSINQKIARRLVDGDKIEILVEEIGYNKKNRDDLIDGMLAGLEGKSDIIKPKNWDITYDKLKNRVGKSSNLFTIAKLFGSSEIVANLLANITNDHMNFEEKISAIRVLANQKNKELINLIPDLILREKNSEVKIAAMKAISLYENNDLANLLYQSIPKLKNNEKDVAIMTLASRPSYAKLLLTGLQNGDINKHDIPAHSVLQLRAVLGNGFVEIWGPIDDVSDKIQDEYLRVSEILAKSNLDKIDISKGKKIYTRLCSACHKMYGEGGEIGPELTGSNRGDLTYLLTNILDPSADVQDDYKLVIIVTQDGRTYSGNIINETDRDVVLRIVGQEPVAIKKSQILNMDISEKSMMPEGLLDFLSDEEIIELIAFLQKVEGPM